MRKNPEDEFLEKKAALVVRQIGHHLLLRTGDSTSRVLPVRQPSSGIFQLKFESEFSFVPDTLVKIIRNDLASIDLPLHYTVEVLACKTNEVVYGFEIGTLKNEIVPCLGRAQPKGCYSIQIAFVDTATNFNSHKHLYLYAIAVCILAIVGFVNRDLLRKEKRLPITQNDAGIKIGSYSFSVENRRLRSATENIELSEKESKLLAILSARPNELISRDQLLKEVWENDGVFTGRSLDMFISKLRKKLKGDASIQIINVHGRGYKLEVA
jgi:DNA-binding winged helix-turn-helix (wHTH) protein